MKYRNLCSLAAAALLLPAASMARPGPSGDVVFIIGVDAQANGQFTLATDRLPSGYACENARPDVYTYLIDATTDAGQSVYATALFAASSRAQVVIKGSGACTVGTEFIDENGEKVFIEKIERIYTLINP